MISRFDVEVVNKLKRRVFRSTFGAELDDIDSMSCFEDEVVAELMMLPVICTLDAEREGVNESISPMVISTLGAELTCRGGNDGI